MFSVQNIDLGQALDGCDGTCKTCEATVDLTIDCSGCTANENGCTYLWENHSFRRDGSAKDVELETNTSKSVVLVTQVMTSDCSGLGAFFGVSVAGALVVFNMNCACPGI